MGLRFLIWGAGGHGKVVADLIRATGGVVFGYIDSNREKLGSIVEAGGGRVVLFHDTQVSLGELPLGADALALAIGDNAIRLSCLDGTQRIALPSLIHPTAIVSPSASIGRATVVFAGAVINASAEIGDAVIVNSGAIVEHDCRIGDGAHLSPGAVLTGNVSVGSRSWIGAGATVVPNVRIGNGATVGAGSVVLEDVPDGCTVVGVPARRIKSRA